MGEMMNKYNARKTMIDGITFESQEEAVRYIQLKMLERAGQIKNLEIQPRFLLQEAYKKNGKSIKAIEYIADFKYTEYGVTQIEDVKGVRTEVYRIKKKLFEKRYPEYTITEI
jgi:hypothetical protein